MCVFHKKELQTELGNILVLSSESGICMVEFDNEKRRLKHLNQIESLLGHPLEIVEKSNAHIDSIENELIKYFKGELISFDTPLHLIGTPFQKSVWEALLSIPYGTTRSYKEQSIAIGDLKAIRAVANANGSNRISIVVPCHRVIGSNGQLTGYGGELWRKKALLELESNQISLF